MIKKIAGSLLLAALCASCTTTTSTTTAASKQTLADRVLAKRIATNSPALPNATNAAAAEPAPPAEGPDDVAASADPAASDPMRNPGLVPTPALRYSAASSTP